MTVQIYSGLNIRGPYMRIRISVALYKYSFVPLNMSGTYKTVSSSVYTAVQ